jgi:hypothetical protein
MVMDEDEEKRFPRLTLGQFLTVLLKPILSHICVHSAERGIDAYTESEIPKSVWRFRKRPEAPKSE